MTASRIVIAAFLGLWPVTALAQVAPPAASDPNSPGQQGQPAAGTNRGVIDNRINNDPGQGKAGEPNAAGNGAGTTGADAQSPPSGPDIIDDPNATPEQKASAEYSGPAVLSRGISASEAMNPKNTKFTPSVGLEFMYTSGLTGVNIQSNGQLSNVNASGVSLTFTLTGSKVYKKDIFNLSFNGSLSHYFQQAGYDGTSDSLTFSWRHMLSRHLSFGLSVAATEFNQNNLLYTGNQYVTSGAGTTLVTASPTTEVFDGRVFSFFTQGSVTYQMNSRLSINLSGGGFMTRRASTSLYGDTGFQAGADIAYRLTRQTTTGIYYGYTHFDYIGTYGSTDVNTVGVDYSIAFDANTQLITRLGASRLETTGLNSVALNPLLALLLGTNSTLEAVYLKNFTPDLNVQLRRQVQNLALTLGYARGVTPGNGVMLTSIQQSATAGLSFKAGRNWNLGNSAGWTNLSSFGTTTQKYESIFLSTSVNRKIYRSLTWHFGFSFNRYLFDSTGFLRNSTSFSTGLVWSPGDVLERVW
jgi:hypothetical protein